MTSIDLFSAISQTARDRIVEAMQSFGEMPFSAESVRDRLGYSVREELDAHGNALGCAFTAMARGGKIRRLESTVPSQRPKSRGRRIFLWRNVP